ncbi:MAG: sulfatase [Gemmatimonadota bacterium]
MTDSRTRRISFASALLLACAFGLATGWSEVALRGVQKFVMGSLIAQSRHIIWMSPVADVLLFLVVGSVLFALGRFVPRAGSFRSFAFVFTALLFAGPLTSNERIHWAAGSLLSLGAAWLISDFLARRERFAMAAARFGAIGLSVATGAGLGLMTLGSRDVEPVASPPPDAPNVLLIVWDTVRGKSVDLGSPASATTPVLAALSRTGVTFDFAVATSSWTLPSHGSLFTGLFPDELEADWEVPLDETPPTLAEVLGGLGYDTGGFAANLLYASWESGLDRGFAHYEDYPVSIRMVLRSGWLTRRLSAWLGILPSDAPFTLVTAEDIEEAFFRWLDGRDGDRPYFAFLNQVDAHKPYTPPDDLYARFAPEHPRARTGAFREWTPGEVEAERAAYEAEIALLDRELGVLLETLDQRDDRRNTLIIVTSDHGELFGEHGLFDHGNSLYRPLLHVPLVLVLPSTLPRGMRIAEPVSIADIPATVMDIVAPGRPHPFPGASILAPVGGRGASRPIRASIRHHRGLHESNPLSRGDMAAVVADGWYYILNGDGTEELFSLSDDADENVNRAGEEAAVVSRLRSLVPEAR